MAQKIIEMGLAPVEEYYGSVRLCYITLGYMLALLTWYVLHNGLETIVDFKQSTGPRRKNG